MQQARVRHLLVLDGGRLAGVLSMRDLLALELDEKEEEVTLLNAYVHSVPATCHRSGERRRNQLHPQLQCSIRQRGCNAADFCSLRPADDLPADLTWPSGQPAEQIAEVHHRGAVFLRSEVIDDLAMGRRAVGHGARREVVLGREQLDLRGAAVDLDLVAQVEAVALFRRSGCRSSRWMRSTFSGSRLTSMRISTGAGAGRARVPVPPPWQPRPATGPDRFPFA